MSSTTLLIGVLPLIVFVIVDSFIGMKAGLIAAVVLAALEALYTIVKFGSIDSVTVASVFLVGLMALVAYKKDSEKIFLFQPVILGGGISAYLIVTYLLGHSLFFDFFTKYHELLPPPVQVAMEHEPFRELLRHCGLTVGITLGIHAAAVAWAALSLNKWWWITIRAVGFYIAIFAGIFMARLLVTTA